MTTLERMLAERTGNFAVAAYWVEFGIRLALGQPEWALAIAYEDMHERALVQELVWPKTREYYFNGCRNIASEIAQKFPVELVDNTAQ